MVALSYNHISEEDDTCATNRVEGIYCLNEDNQISCQTDGDCPPPSEYESYYCEGVCLAIPRSGVPYTYIGSALTFSSPLARQSNRYLLFVICHTLTLSDIMSLYQSKNQMKVKIVQMV